MELLKALIIVSEKAANIARVCRQHEHLFELLVQKKRSNEANPRFVEDFKTLADVLIQEMIKHDIKQQFQALSNISGEENNVLENKLGIKICVVVKESEKETADLLSTVLNGDQVAAALLAAEVHRHIDINDIKTKIPTEGFEIRLEELGIWIDPIDCTAEYISGGKGYCDQNIYLKGLKCVTVLIGVFNMVSGLPVMGVVNRPFLEDDDFMSHLRCIWGVSLDNLTFNSGLSYAERKKVICISSSEEQEVKQILKEKGFHTVEASGAGYKILTVILGLADAYLLTKGTTFKWDTCAPHSILKSLGGDIVDYRISMKNAVESITYIDQNSCNVNGIIAYRDIDSFTDIMNALNK
ncbi:hypothetical protein NQ317_004691 [Molorchus minor]|uniref:Inositol polyphosphate 1-phosphatase n=1 Tax=Molorchus minor TaxID=1323400 RepID=A0ABQ9JEH1_9CUCU|nr:hypothetical protein NQ317_004691 [Molorchus minor]